LEALFAAANAPLCARVDLMPLVLVLVLLVLLVLMVLSGLLGERRRELRLDDA
jgi:hypothetical protein